MNLYSPQSMPSILILGATLVNEGTLAVQDVLIRNGRIEEIGRDLAGRKAELIIEADGKVLMPGMIDDQVHFREPGLTHKADIHTESKAALVGGITSYMDMPNTRPPAITLEALEAKYSRAAARSLANFSFYLGATNENIDTIRSVDPASVCGIKVFMGASTGNMLVDDSKTLDAIFAQAPVLIATHCEDTPTILENVRRFREKYGEDVPMACHPFIRSAEACLKSSSLAVDLARRHATRLHILHLTTARELALLSNDTLLQKRITAEVCIHHLYFDEADYGDKGTLIKCNPAIKTRDDRKALIQALVDHKLDVIATDHAPHTLEEKQQSYFKAPSGLPLVQHALPALLELYHDGVLSLELIVSKTSHAVAQCFHMKDRGFIREGYWADLILVDLNKSFTVRRRDVLHKCGWSPFEGRRLRSSIHTTIVSGQLAYHQGRFDDQIRGRRLEFEGNARG
jgi:dihydroorotase